MVGAKTETGSSEPFAKRSGFDESAQGTRSRNPVVYVVCALVGCAYSLPVDESTLRYVLFGAGIGALGGIALSGAGSFLDRLLALDATAVGTVVVAVASLVVWVWYLGSLARGSGNGSPTWVVWLFSCGYIALMMLLFFILAVPILG
jgi:hypothetical protein